MYMQSQIEIGKLNKNIKDIRKENEKMRNNINGADIDASSTFSQIILKKDSVKCLTNEQIKVINNVFLDLDECEQELLALGKIVTIQDTMLKSKIDLVAMYKKQDEYNEELKYQLTASINTQIQRFNALESSIKKDAKQQKRKGIAIGSSLGQAIVTGKQIGRAHV